MAAVHVSVLEAFLEQQLMRAFVWGKADCCLMLADWMVANGRDDPASLLRGTYDSEDGCHQVVEAAGGIVTLVGGCAASAGLIRVSEAVLGDVGVIGAHEARDRQWGAIFDGASWAVRWSNDILRLKARPLVIYGIRSGSASGLRPSATAGS